MSARSMVIVTADVIYENKERGALDREALEALQELVSDAVTEALTALGGFADWRVSEGYQVRVLAKPYPQERIRP